VEEEVFGLEIRQRDGVRYVEYPLTCRHISKYGSGARKKKGREVVHRGGGEESSSSNSLNPLVSNSPLWGVI
jgi:hypothetical protein